MYKYNLPSATIMYSHISAAMKQPVTADQISIIDQTPSTDPRGSTMIILKAVDGGLFSGQRNYYYNKVDINNIVSGLALSVPFDAYSNSYEVLSALNAKYGFSLTFEEIEKVDYGDLKAAYYELTISSNSLVWKGVLKVAKDNAPNSLAKLMSRSSITEPLVSGYRRGKLTGELMYAPYEFNTIAAQLDSLVDGTAQEYKLVEILKLVISDPWEYKKGIATEWNLSGSRVEKLKKGAYRIVRIHLTNECTFVDGFIELKYIV